MASLLLLCVCLMGVVADLPEPQTLDLENAEIYFERFIQEYDRQYPNEYEKQIRFLIFKDNLEKAIRKNEKSTSTVFGVTQFMDLTVAEFHKSYTGFRTNGLKTPCSFLNDENIDNYADAPDSFDWRDQNVVSPVKQQGNCGSCYAFAATGNIESLYTIKYKQQILVSEQQILDCDKSNDGCAGGYMTNAFRYLIETGGSETEIDYPYKHFNKKCVFNATKVKVKLTDCHAFNLTSQEKLKQLLYNNGSISIAMKGDGIQAYKEGIIADEDCTSGPIDHAVLLVGYGTSEFGEPYWIVKNSWGATWGEHGYFRMQRGEDAVSCGIMNEAMSTAVIA